MTIVGRGLGIGSVGSVVLFGLGSDVVSGQIKVPVKQAQIVVEHLIDAGVVDHEIAVSQAEHEFDVAIVDFQFDIEVVTVSQIIEVIDRCLLEGEG